MRQFEPFARAWVAIVNTTAVLVVARRQRVALTHVLSKPYARFIIVYEASTAIGTLQATETNRLACAEHVHWRSTRVTTTKSR